MKRNCEKFKALPGHRKKDIFTGSLISLVVLDGIVVITIYLSQWLMYKMTETGSLGRIKFYHFQTAGKYK